MNLKLQINLIITMLLALVMLLGVWMMIEHAREDVHAEVDSTTVLALHLLDAEIQHYTSDYTWFNGPVENGAPVFRLRNLDNIRHLKIEFFDASGQLRDSNRPLIGEGEKLVPVWFETLMNKVSSSMKATYRPIVVNKRYLGELVITPDPSYEIAEIWHDSLGLLGLVAIFFFVVNCLVYWAVGRALRPVNKLLFGLMQLEQGRLNTRLPEFSLPELSDISSKFNAMAQTLENSMLNNYLLTQQIIRIQEDERKNLARNLHDEIGQHLTAIQIDSSAITKANNITAAHKSAVAIESVARQMMDIVREMLQRLRPGVLDELGLQVALQELIDNWRQRNMGVSTSVSISSQLKELDETVAIAAYRIVQESLTNISKHSGASQVTIKVECQSEHLHLLLKDNGAGFDPSQTSHGFGLAGMRERVAGLGGTFHLGTGMGLGVLVSVNLPANSRMVYG